MKYKECNHVELKQIIPKDFSFEEEVVSFLNSEAGGTIYIGIDNHETIVGLDDPDGVQLNVKDRIKNNIAPSTLGLFDVVLEEIESKFIVKVLISTGNKKPYYIRKRGMCPEGCYIRIGSGKDKMTEEMIQDLYASHHQVSLKDIPSPKKDLTFRQLKIFYEGNNKTLDDVSFLSNLGLLTDDGRYNYNAYLLADGNSVPIPVARYADDDRQDLLEAKECGFKSILTAANEILSMVEAYNKRYMHKTNKGNETAYMYEYDAVKEAVVNAILHNDYTMSSTPSINFYCDRIEIISAGGLPQGLTKDAFFKGIISRRNPELVKVFQDVHLTENLGSGMRKIMKYYDESCFEFVGKYIICTFKYKPNPFVDEGKAGAENGVENGAENKRTLVDSLIKLIKEKPSISKREMASTIGVSSRVIDRIIKNSKIIIHVGPDKGGHWEIKED